MKTTTAALAILALSSFLVPTVHAVTFDWATVGDPYNDGELSGAGAGGYGPDAIVGGVDTTYRISKHEVTNAQYAEFLEAVADSDPNGLYSTTMASGWNDIGGISRSGSDGSYSYAARPNRGNRPVNYVSWYDTLRFANWLHNGQPTGAQDASTTENGAYDMSLGAGVVRKSGATVFLPSENEWYKAAYYKGGGTSAGYWDYPTESDTLPTSETPAGTDMTNGSANYYDGGFVDSTYWTTEVGAYNAKPSDSPYGTFDQGGNVWEWNETVITGSSRGLRGGSFYSYYLGYLHAADRRYDYPTNEYSSVGFRVASIPEPGSITLLLTMVVAFEISRRRSK